MSKKESINYEMYIAYIKDVTFKKYGLDKCNNSSNGNYIQNKNNNRNDTISEKNVRRREM